MVLDFHLDASFQSYWQFVPHLSTWDLQNWFTGEKRQNCGVFKKPKGENETSAGNENFPREGKFPPKESQNPRQKVTFPRRVIFPLEGHFPPSAQLSPISNALGLIRRARHNWPASLRF